ncbi:hypothetical protein PA08_1168 [Cutibacterium modestum P08]|nr:hypothetical protein PA08_1168 [Cutibacterium modestum P08]
MDGTAIVGNLDLDRVLIAAPRYGHLAGAGMGLHIIEGLLNDPVTGMPLQWAHYGVIPNSQ